MRRGRTRQQRLVPRPQSGDDTATVSVEDLGASGPVLVDSTGKALYAADEEADRSVVCTGACTSFWMPLTIDRGAPSGNSLASELAVVERGDGTRQVTFDGSGSIRSSKTSRERSPATGSPTRSTASSSPGTSSTSATPPTRIRTVAPPAGRMATRRLVATRPIVATDEPARRPQVHPRRCSARPAMGPHSTRRPHRKRRPAEA